MQCRPAVCRPVGFRGAVRAPAGVRGTGRGRDGPLGMTLGTMWGRPVCNPSQPGDYMWMSYISVTTRCRGNCRHVAPRPQAPPGAAARHAVDLHKRHTSPIRLGVSRDGIPRCWGRPPRRILHLPSRARQPGMTDLLGSDLTPGRSKRVQRWLASSLRTRPARPLSRSRAVWGCCSIRSEKATAERRKAVAPSEPLVTVADLDSPSMSDISPK